MLTVIKSGGSNINSIISCLKRLDIKHQLTDDAETISNASHLILPGVGYAGHIMNNLRNNQLIDVIANFKNPFLGICLGMQLLYQDSEEGNCSCLGLISSSIKHLPESHHPIPHMGWNRIKTEKTNPIIDKNDYYYFVHSYFAPLTEETIASCEYGFNFSAAVKKENFFGVQFHPERSGQAGENLFKRFIKL